MSTNAENFLELLNGLLDGALTDDERRRLDLAMKEDPTLDETLNELIAMRRSLLRGRSVGRLGPNFARSVVLAARERADMMGDKAPEWLQPSDASRSLSVATPRLSESRSLTRSATPGMLEPTGVSSFDRPIARRAIRVWIPGLALAAAASLLLYFSTSFWSPEPLAQPLVSDFQPGARLENDASDTNAAATDLLPLNPERIASADTTDLPSTTNTEPVTQADLLPGGNDKEGSIGSMPIEETSALAANSPSVPAETLNVAPGSTEVAVADAPKNGVPTAIENMLANKGVTTPFFTLLADVTIDPVAHQNDALRDLLEEHEILYADDLNLDKKQLDTLVDSNMIGPISQGEKSLADAEVSVMFVRGRSTRIDAFLVALEGQYRDFPLYTYGMTFEPSVLTLVDQLSKVVTNNEAARRLTYGDDASLGLVTAFPNGGRSPKYMDIEIRKESAVRNENRKPVLNDSVSYLILLVRKLPE